MSNQTCVRLGRLLITLLLALSWTNLPLFLVMPASAAPANEPSPEAMLALLRRLVATSEKELRAPGANPADVQSKAAELGYDVARTFTFVRDEIRYEPYRGVLRGARGALASRAGNSLDKTLLLEALLKTGGHQARLMRGQLPPDRAEALVRQFLEGGSTSPTADELMTKPAFPPALTAKLGLGQADIDAIIAENKASVRQFMNDATATATVETDYLKAQLDAAGVQLGRSYEQWITELRTRTADHVWLELVGTDGSTTVLDPSFANTKAGDAPAVADGKPLEDPTLAADRHTIVFELYYGVREGSGQAQKQLLEVPIYADESLHEPPMLTIQPVDPLPSMEAMLKMNREELIKLFTGFKQYQAVVTIGHRHWASPAFDLKGNITPISSDGRVAGAQKFGGALGSGFGALGGGGGEEKDVNNFIDLSVMLTFKSPGSKPTSQQRVLLTQAQTTGKEFLSPILDWRMLIQPQPLTPEFVGYESLQNTIEVLRPALPLLEPSQRAEASFEGMARLRPSPFPSRLVNLAMLRQLAAANSGSAPVALLWDRPQMSILEQRICANPEAGHTCGRVTIDLVANALSFVPKAADAAPAAAQMAMRQGVFDTVAESMVLAEKPGSTSLTGAIGDLIAAREVGSGLIAAAPDDATTLAKTSLAQSDRQWIARYESPDRRVLAPPARAAAATPLSAWWSIDPATGNAVGRRDGGRGQSNAEYAVQMATGVICMVFTTINYRLDTARGATSAQGSGFMIALAGCALGAGFGVSAIGTSPIVNGGLTLVNALIAGALGLLGGHIARNG
jgi:hypothetical protein